MCGKYIDGTRCPPPPCIPIPHSPPQLSWNMDENAVAAMIAKTGTPLLHKMVCFCLHLFAICDFSPPQLASEEARIFFEMLEGQ